MMLQWILLNSVQFWLIMVVVLLVSELATMGLTTIWFALGALIAMALAAVGSPFPVQFLVFAVVSVLTMAFVRSAALRHFNQGRTKTNVDGLIGQKAIVTQKINNVKAEGQAVLNGMEWTARSVSDSEIEEGAVVVVKRVSGVKLIVEKEEIL